MQTRNYETVFITNPMAPEAKVSELKARVNQIIEASKGRVINWDDWGKRKMAYPIRKEHKGHYFCFTYSADNKGVAELERNLRINEDVFRFLTVKLDEKVDPLQAIQAFKTRLEAHAKREKERAERDAERAAQRAQVRRPEEYAPAPGDQGPEDEE
ncbi:MAG: 30S ribosomal protein S6 [Oligoflexia bacterium]|nr:30S ribosomal protein S6 [Oligoflexia bacterium]